MLLMLRDCEPELVMKALSLLQDGAIALCAWDYVDTHGSDFSVTIFRTQEDLTKRAEAWHWGSMVDVSFLRHSLGAQSCYRSLDLL
jgi:hypothetical protein